MTTAEAAPKAPGGTAMLAGRRVARIGFGAMQLAEQRAGHPAPDRQVAMTVLRAAVEQGVNHIDTAQFPERAGNQRSVTRCTPIPRTWPW